MTTPGAPGESAPGGPPIVPPKQTFELFDLGSPQTGRRAPLPIPEGAPSAKPEGGGQPGGELVMEDGSTQPLEGTYVMGRSPGSAEEVAAGRALPLVLDDDTGGISRVHARIGPSRRGVELTDLGSRNGTQVLGPGESEWRRLSPNDSVLLRGGARIAIGSRRIEFRAADPAPQG